MASFSSQAFSRGKELVREGDGEEDDGEELLDPRVKVSNLRSTLYDNFNLAQLPKWLRISLILQDCIAAISKDQQQFLIFFRFN